MHYPTFLLPIVGAIVAPVLWLISSLWHAEQGSFLPVILCWVLCLVVAYKDNQRPKNLFISSGNTKAAIKCYELILTSKGQGDDFFSSHRPLGFADIQDFSYKRGKQIDFAHLLKTRPFSVEPYCVDDERRQIIFVEMPMAFDSAMVGPFYFCTQRDFAKRLYAVPYEEFHSVCENLGEIDMTRLILLYNTSRCGSTLVSKAFDSLAGVQSISEPDMFTSLTHMAAEAQGDPDKLKDISRIARSTARLLLHLRGNRYPDRPILCLKFRFQVINICDILKEALPDANSMFLYRNAIDVIDSMGSAFINGGLYRAIRAIGLDVAYVYHFSALPTQLWKLIPLFGDKTLPQKEYKCLGAVSPFTLGWMSVMEKALEAQRNGWITTFFRYEDLIQHKSKLLTKVLDHAGFEPSSDMDRTDETFGEDVQDGSVVQSARKQSNNRAFVYLKSFDVSNITRVISLRPEVNHSDFIIPGTIQV